jgi:UDPglucose 6-dehydrogenase
MEELAPTMQIAVIGTGRVGLVTAVALASVGHRVRGVDANMEVVELLQQGRTTFYEPGLDELLREQLAEGRLSFTGSAPEALAGADVIFICVGRPVTTGGDASMTAVEAAARDVARHASSGVVVVTKSTVPPGSCERIARALEFEHPGLQFHVVSSPEFLREGRAIQDALEPDRIVVGAEERSAFELMRKVYAPMLRDGCILVETDRRTAELAKLASNAFLATKVSFMNGVARTCELTGADVRGVAEIMGADPRIGPAFLAAGLGYGGYCLPKDVDTLGRVAGRAGFDFGLLAEVARINEGAVDETVRRVEDALWNLEEKRVALFGLAFKPDTDDVRAAPALALAQRLLAAGAEIVGCDPMAAAAAKNALPEIHVVSDPYEAAEGAHCIVLCTEWRLFRELDLERLRRAMTYPVMVDARNLFSPDVMKRAGFVYVPIGRSS